MFGFQTPNVRNAMRFLYDTFDQLIVLKPISSRPASSERYVVCSGFRGLPQFDGPKWMNNVMLRRETYHDKIRYSYLDRRLDEIDRDVLQLNLKACFGILSYLDRKTAAQNTRTMMQDDGASWSSQRSSLNVEMYKQAWRLN